MNSKEPILWYILRVPIIPERKDFDRCRFLNVFYTSRKWKYSICFMHIHIYKHRTFIVLYWSKGWKKPMNSLWLYMIPRHGRVNISPYAASCFSFLSVKSHGQTLKRSFYHWCQNLPIGVETNVKYMVYWCIVKRPISLFISISFMSKSVMARWAKCESSRFIFVLSLYLLF